MMSYLVGLLFAFDDDDSKTILNSLLDYWLLQRYRSLIYMCYYETIVWCPFELPNDDNITVYVVDWPKQNGKISIALYVLCKNVCIEKKNNHKITDPFIYFAQSF